MHKRIPYRPLLFNVGKIKHRLTVMVANDMFDHVFDVNFCCAAFIARASSLLNT